MKKFLAALALGTFALAHGPTLAQDKKSEPAKEQVKKADATKVDAKAIEAKKEGKKKVKKGGC